MTLMASRFQDTPAADQVFGTVELAEAILSELPFEDLLDVMRTCKSFCTIIKTSKSVMRNKVWLTVEEKKKEADKSSDSEDDSDSSDSSSGCIIGCEIYDLSHATYPPCFRQYVSFQLATTINNGRAHAFEMDSDFESLSIFESLGLDEGIPHTLKIEYRHREGLHAHGKDTIITVDPANSDEMWRHLPLTNAPGGVCVEIFEGVQGPRGVRLPRTSTIGDMCDWLFGQVADCEPPPIPSIQW